MTIDKCFQFKILKPQRIKLEPHCIMGHIKIVSKKYDFFLLLYFNRIIWTFIMFLAAFNLCRSNLWMTFTWIRGIYYLLLFLLVHIRLFLLLRWLATQLSLFFILTEGILKTFKFFYWDYFYVSCLPLNFLFFVLEVYCIRFDRHCELESTAKTLCRYYFKSASSRK